MRIDWSDIEDFDLQKDLDDYLAAVKEFTERFERAAEKTVESYPTVVNSLYGDDQRIYWLSGGYIYLCETNPNIEWGFYYHRLPSSRPLLIEIKNLCKRQNYLRSYGMIPETEF